MILARRLSASTGWRRVAKMFAAMSLLTVARSQELFAQETRAELESLAALAASEDSAGPRGSLKRAIGSFESQWRKMWQVQQYARHGQMDTVDLKIDNRARISRVRRYWSLQCAQVTPGNQVALSKNIQLDHNTAPIRMKPVVTLPDRGVVCPLWYPPDDTQ